VSGLRGKDRGLNILVFILVLYSIIFISIAIWRYEHFLHDGSGDLLLFEQLIYNTSHGKLFYNNFSGQNHFGDHNSTILSILAIFSSILPAQYVLYIFTALSITVSSIPIYLITKDNFDSETWPIFLTVSYLMLPTFVGQFYQSFHEINLVLPFLPFIVMLVMSLLVKEDVALTLFMFSVYALIKKRDCKWYVAPAILSISWFTISVKVIIPFFNKNNTYSVGIGYFSNLGSSFTQILINTIANPLSTLKAVLLPDKVVYLFILLLPVGLLLPFFSYEFIFAIPSIAFNMLAATGRFRFVRYVTGTDVVYVPRHMSLMASVFLFISAIYAIKRIGSFSNEHSRQFLLATVSLIILLILYNDKFIVNKYLYFDEPQVKLMTPSVESLKKALSLIPYEATVKSGIRIATHLYNRKESHYNIDNTLDTDYILITKLDTKDLNKVEINNIINKYELIASEENYGLYKKRNNIK
jgi:uncharacterized membrane protein